MAERIYWDSCAWIGLINEETDKIVGCQHCLELAKQGKVQIWTSTLTLAEVYKKKCGNHAEGIDPGNDDAFVQFVGQEFVWLVQVDQEIGEKARELLRKHPGLKKPADAIHLATAVVHNLDVMYTFDKDNLLGLSELVAKNNGTALTICNPPPPPPPPVDETAQLSFDLLVLPDARDLADESHPQSATNAMSVPKSIPGDGSSNEAHESSSDTAQDDARLDAPSKEVRTQQSGESTSAG